MKTGAFFAAILFTCLFVSGFAGQAGPPGWKGTIATENGIKVVKNPAEPLYGDFAFDLEEDLAIGGDPAKEDYYLPKGGSLSVDSEGNLYLSPFGGDLIRMYDRAGKFLRPVGRKGQGPGEYAYPGPVLFDPKGNPCVWGAREMVCFGKDGAFKKKVSIKTFLSTSVLGPRGTIIGTTQPGRGPEGPKYTLLQLDPEGALLRTVAEYRGEFKANQVAIVLHSYSNRIAFEALTAETFVYGFSEEYKIHVADAEGRTTLLIAKDEKPFPISGKEKEEIRKNGIYALIGTNEKRLDDDAFPDHRPFFGRFFTDDAGRIYVVRNRSILEKDLAREIDVFSKDGYYLYRMSWPFIPSAIKGGFLYQVREDKETSEYQVVRYKIKNWNSMKSGLE
jgi:hypothetical protein